MSRARNLNSGCRIRVYIPGPPGPPLTNLGSFIAPILIDGGALPVPNRRSQRAFIQAQLGPVVQPILANPPDNGVWELILQVVGGYAITLNNASNIQLSQTWNPGNDSILSLLWDGHSQWVENYRSAIFISREVHGSAESPISIDPTIGIIPTMASDQVWWIQPVGATGQTWIIAANAIAPGFYVGQRLTLKSVQSPNFLVIPDGAGTDQNGDCYMGRIFNLMAQSIVYTWDGINWSQDGGKRF